MLLRRLDGKLLFIVCMVVTSWTKKLLVMGSLVCPSVPQSYVSWSLTFLAWSPTVNRPEGRFEMNHNSTLSPHDPTPISS